MRQIFSILICAGVIIISSNNINAQGCVAIRSTGGICTMNHSEQTDTSSKWEFNANNRYFKSFRHFIGTAEQKQRVEQGSVIIHIHLILPSYAT